MSMAICRYYDVKTTVALPLTPSGLVFQRIPISKFAHLEWFTKTKPPSPKADLQTTASGQDKLETLSHSQLFSGSSKSCVVNFAFFAWNPFNLPRVVRWYHWNPQNRPKGALFRGYKKSRIFFKKSVKILNWPWRAHFWAHRHLSYHFGNLWPSTWEWLKGNCGHVTSKGGLSLVEKSYCRFGIFEQF